MSGTAANNTRIRASGAHEREATGAGFRLELGLPVLNRRPAGIAHLGNVVTNG